MLSGSVAMSIYTLPRATRDFDFIVHLQEKDLYSLTEHFKGDYYLEVDAVKDSIKNHSIFNIIDHASGFKADFVILKNEEFRQAEFSRRRQTEFYGTEIWVVTPEDLLISKLFWIQDLQSALQMEDIRNLSSIENLDWNYIHDWVIKLKLNTFNLIQI
jgi:hypothetical protein